VQILITGAGGFVGKHLIAQLQTTYPNATIHGTTFSSAEVVPDGVIEHPIDLRDLDKVEGLLAGIKPVQIYHLAAQSSVARSFQAPWETLENNIQGQLNLFLACIKLEIQPRILVISSSEIYGPVSEAELPITENSALRPNNPYSVSKVTQDMLAYQYFQTHDVQCIRTRSFNHFGPGQTERFVAPAFALQIARIEAGQQKPIIRVGNLEAKRDFTDVRDVIRAYTLLMEKGQPGEVYNVASGQPHSAQDILDILLANTTADVDVEVDPDRLRPVEVPVIYGNAARLLAHTGWQPTITFEQSIIDILEDCRNRI